MAEVKFSWANAFRDIVVRSIDRGQFLFVALWLMGMVILIKMPGEDVSKMMNAILERLERGELFAYVVNLLVLGGWYFHARWMRKQAAHEFDRIGTEKSRLQDQLTGLKLEGSKARK